MIESVLLMDIGGTHTRARLLTRSGDLFKDSEVLDEVATSITDRESLLGVISDFQSHPGSTITASVLSFAGPIRNNSLTMTNWPARDVISLEDMVASGLPDDSTLIVNDMEAAANALIAYNEGKVELDKHGLYTNVCSGELHFNNSVLMIPGTGVGVAAIVMPAGKDRKTTPVYVSCELQHTEIHELDGEYGELVEAMKRVSSKTYLSWEDFVSGKGLENIYQCLCTINVQDGPHISGLTANSIAMKAVNGSDKLCSQALDCYYSFAGRLAQIAALAFQPFAGIYLAGETTRKNRSFIGQSDFIKQLQSNAVRGELLRSFPVYLVPEYMNLYGAMFIAEQHYP